MRINREGSLIVALEMAETLSLELSQGMLDLRDYALG